MGERRRALLGWGVVMSALALGVDPGNVNVWTLGPLALAGLLCLIDLGRARGARWR